MNETPTAEREILLDVRGPRADTGAPVACCIHRSGVTRPKEAARSNSAPKRDPRSFSSSWKAMKCPIG